MKNEFPALAHFSTETTHKGNVMQMLQIPPKTMSSREIAELTGKDHGHVRRDIYGMLIEVGYTDQEISDGYVRSWIHLQNKQSYQEFVLDRRLTDCLLTGYNAKARIAVIDRWMELENRQPKPSLPASYIEALEALVSSEKEKQEAQAKLQIQAPMIDVYNTLADRKDCTNTQGLAKTLGVSPQKLNKFLKFKKIKMAAKDLPMSPFEPWFNVVDGVSNDREYKQCLITPLGQIEITKRWNKHNKIEVMA